LIEQQEKCKYTFSTNNELARHVNQIFNNCLIANLRSIFQIWCIGKIRSL